MIKSKLLGVAVAVAILTSVGQARAEEWQFSATPYLWMVNLNGEQTIKGTTVDVDVKFSDLFTETDSIFALQGHFELHNGTFGFFIDPTYMTLTMSDKVPAGKVNIDFDYTLVEIGGTYRVATLRQESGEDTLIELIAGGRYTSFDATIKPPTPLPKVKGDADWIDPFVGVRTKIPMKEGVSLSLRGDVGGFGIGSDFTGNAIALVGWDTTVFGNDATILAGYRVLYQDYATGSGTNRFAYDVTTHGPIIGLNIKF